MSAPISAAESAFVALGSNLGNSPRILRAAMQQLAAISTQPLASSSLWQTSPVDCPPGSPPFVNAVVVLAIADRETPESLLAKLQAIEKDFGRRPKQVLNEPRPLDLDLIVFGRETRNTPELTLPHPRAHLRKFVLQPLSEIAPELVWPGETRDIRALLKMLPANETLVRLAT